VKQKLAGAGGLVIEPVPHLPGTDVEVLQPDLGLFHHGKRIHDADPSGPQGLHLRPGQHDAGLEDFLEVVLVTRPTVQDDRLVAGIGFVPLVLGGGCHGLLS